jgi:pilus assembly protein Flp/PilA
MLLIYLRARLGREDGQTMVEYGLIVALVALAAIVGLGALGTSVNDMFNGIADQLGSAI